MGSPHHWKWPGHPTIINSVYVIEASKYLVLVNIVFSNTFHEKSIGKSFKYAVYWTQLWITHGGVSQATLTKGENKEFPTISAVSPAQSGIRGLLNRVQGQKGNPYWLHFHLRQNRGDPLSLHLSYPHFFSHGHQAGGRVQGGRRTKKKLKLFLFYHYRVFAVFGIWFPDSMKDTLGYNVMSGKVGTYLYTQIWYCKM